MTKFSAPFAIATLLCCLGAAVAQSPVKDRIDSLPGIDIASLNFGMYSGYISIGDGKYYFYWFVESARSPATDPVILWLNGGPGCSSLGGLLSENGPFFPTANATLAHNPWSWNNVANMLYIESPAGVGFSYSEQPIHYNDTITANDNYLALVQFFKAYSYLAKNDFYVSGESYAGHYVPQLAHKIWEESKTNPSMAPNSIMKGILVGNPSTEKGPDFYNTLTLFYQTHGLLPYNVNSTGSDPKQGINPYDILDDVCTANRLKNYIRFPHPLVDRLRAMEVPKRYVPDQDACIDAHLDAYLNNPSVQQSLHVRPTTWNHCGGPQYDYYMGSIVPVYEDLMDYSNYKILVYAGDQDCVINFLSTEAWIFKMNRKVISAWKPWFYSRSERSGNQVAGWGTTFDRISFRTVKGAGHMVPWSQPAPALRLLNDFLSGSF